MQPTHEGRAVVVDRARVGAELTSDLAQAGAVARADHAIQADDHKAVAAVRLREDVERAFDDLRVQTAQEHAAAPPTCRPSERR